MIHLIDAAENFINLSLSPLFVKHYENTNNCAEFILNEINNSTIYNEFFPYFNDGIVLDVGANVGLVSLFLRPIAKQIYYVEPTPSHIEVFRELLNLNEIKDIQIIQCALYKLTGNIEFSLTKNSTQNSLSAYGNAYDPKISVPSYTLYDLLKQYNIETVDFLKMDIEGSEKDIFEDEMLPLALEKVKSLYIELHPVPVMDYEKMIKLLISSGYIVKRYERDGHLHAIFGYKETL